MTVPTIDDFIGDYLIRQGSVQETDPAVGGPSGDPRRLVEAGRTLTLAPSSSGERTLDLTLVDTATGDPLLGPLPCRLRPEIAALYFRTVDYEGTGQPLVIQVSLYRDEASDYRSIYGVMVFGDPDNVGVWGADETGGG